MTQLTTTANAAPASAATTLDLATALLGPSAAMMQLWTQLRRLAPHARCVLLTGEAHCGQEAVARVLLELSLQRQRRFVVLPAAQAESTLARSTGLASIPQDAFLFLPDAHGLALAAQAGILTLLRMRRTRPFTVVAATQENLRALVGVGRFLPELADTLSAVRVSVPALRDRKEDLPMLLNQKLCAESTAQRRPLPTLGKSFLQAALQHHWPGNLRELEKVIAFLLTGSAAELTSQDFTTSLSQVGKVSEATLGFSSTPVRMVSLDTIAQEHIRAVLRGCRGNKLRAAEVLGISRSTLYRMLDTAAGTTAAATMAEPSFC